MTRRLVNGDDDADSLVPYHLNYFILALWKADKRDKNVAKIAKIINLYFKKNVVVVPPARNNDDLPEYEESSGGVQPSAVPYIVESTHTRAAKDSDFKY
ncbi:CLUMA_CG011223, isoform A [Clunio marinus]|uniref:CLUMA_CG011223, isoform A n=1 Tax=Clunio marinus TaxID=568069 RepID=A0A1J1IC38_9DIPT|nr:CLUMA_CG011223, isoform A [Clunio marinus]